MSITPKKKIVDKIGLIYFTTNSTGKVGGWRDYFDEEMTKECERWMAKKVEETGIQFPTYP